MKKLTFILIVFTAFISCKKDDKEPDTTTNQDSSIYGDYTGDLHRTGTGPWTQDSVGNWIPYTYDYHINPLKLEARKLWPDGIQLFYRDKNDSLVQFYKDFAVDENGELSDSSTYPFYVIYIKIFKDSIIAIEEDRYGAGSFYDRVSIKCKKQ